MMLRLCRPLNDYEGGTNKGRETYNSPYQLNYLDSIKSEWKSRTFNLASENVLLQIIRDAFLQTELDQGLTVDNLVL